ncbi:hypothetical protein RclHR1_13780005 [Rhizophagus clarus]|uniref:Uncharacterized protein n=1 Tax=Rhizophagus clarus TaxID=94130 RepID=A0A2Z6QAZ9_9GLOM|nr:hypothetical protein RclHR1_13780005 [Rhizophagus clarus]GES80692.1 hypothetical protein GLOIN_2v1786610 [Rhizophagus clarus]
MASYPSPPLIDNNEISTTVASNNNTIDINTVLKDNTINDYYAKIISIISEFRKNSKNYGLISSILAVPYYALMHEGFLTTKKEMNYKIKINGKSRNYNIIFDSELNLEKPPKKIDEDFAKLIGYNLNGLPSLAKLLAVGNYLDNESVNQRLEWMKLSEFTYKYNEKHVV